LEKEKYHIISLICGIKKQKSKQKTKQTPISRGQTDGCQQGGTWGGMGKVGEGD